MLRAAPVRLSLPSPSGSSTSSPHPCSPCFVFYPWLQEMPVCTSPALWVHPLSNPNGEGVAEVVWTTSAWVPSSNPVVSISSHCTEWLLLVPADAISSLTVFWELVG